jgi:hypothetical protein
MTLPLDIKRCGRRTRARPWSAQIEVPDGLALSGLHSTIQELIDFDDDHLHEFFVGRSWRDRTASVSEADLDEGEDVPLSGVVPLPKGQKLYYAFDFGDNWPFEEKATGWRQQCGNSHSRKGSKTGTV